MGFILLIKNKKVIFRGGNLFIEGVVEWEKKKNCSFFLLSLSLIPGDWVIWHGCGDKVSQQMDSIASGISAGRTNTSGIYYLIQPNLKFYWLWKRIVKPASHFPSPRVPKQKKSARHFNDVKFKKI